MVGFLITLRLFDASEPDDAVLSGSQASLATFSCFLHLLLDSSLLRFDFIDNSTFLLLEATKLFDEQACGADSTSCSSEATLNASSLLIHSCFNFSAISL